LHAELQYEANPKIKAILVERGLLDGLGQIPDKRFGLWSQRKAAKDMREVCRLSRMGGQALALMVAQPRRNFVSDFGSVSAGTPR